MSSSARRHRGFTITELLIVIAVIVTLLALLLPALSPVWSSGKMTGSMNNLRQIALWMAQYSGDNGDIIVPSQFNYDYPDPSVYRGKVRSGLVETGQPNMGTWTDILWTVFEVGAVEADPTAGVPDYRFDSPDKVLYDNRPDWKPNPFRAAAPNTRRVTNGTGPRPFGNGAQEEGYPGYFAANNFFNADWASPTFNNCDGQCNGFFSNGQIKVPDQSLYALDSYAGEVIEDEPGPFDYADNDGDGLPDTEADFRYVDQCLMLFLDGHVEQQGPWQNLDVLQGPRGRGVRVQDLTTR